MAAANDHNRLVAAFPRNEREIVLVFPEAVHPSMENPDRFRFESGVAVKNALLDERHPDRLRLEIDAVSDAEILIDEVEVTDLRSSDGTSHGRVHGPRFVHGIRSPMELKVPHLEARFPYTSTLVGLHVSVMCCTGCNGGVHDRNLVVVNNHSGGGWSGIWVRTGQTIEGPYPRWQRVLFAGGVIAEDSGSTTVVDHGWMTVEKGDEEAHHAPPPLPIETIDLPGEPTTSLLCKSLDATWVQFNDITIASATAMAREKQPTGSPEVRLPRMELVITDDSGGRSLAWLYQPSAFDLRDGQRLRQLRGFVHAEERGQYVLLSDKEEDIFLA